MRPLVRPQTKELAMLSESALKALFDRWERVWHEQRLDLVPECIARAYVRHDEVGDQTITPEAYAEEIAALHQARPQTRFAVYEHSFTGDRAWFRFNLLWNDPSTGETQHRAGMQLYRIAGGKLAETWLSLMPPGSAWPDVVAKDHWTS
jgi:SnoaL-like domain